MILRGKDEYSTQEEEAIVMVSDKEKSEGAYPCEGELLMIRRTLNNQPIVKEESKRETIFQTRCKFE